MSGLAALIAAGAQLAGAGINAGTSYWNRQNDLALLQYQNTYNSPLEQMKRGIAAGINPNALAQGIAGSPGYGNMAAADAASVSNALPNDLGTQIGNSVNSALNAEMVKANIKNTNADTKGKELDNDLKDATFDTQVQMALDRGAITAAEAKNAKYLAEKYPEMIDLGIEEQRAEIDKKRSEKTKIDKEVDRIDQEIKESNKRIEKLEQDIKTSKSQEALNYANAALAQERTRNQQLLNDKQEMENRREELTGSATGVVAAYFDIEKEKGTEAADKWLEESNDVMGKVIKNSSKSSAEGAQEVYDDTPEGQIKRGLQAEMNEKLDDIDRQIKKLSPPHNSLEENTIKNLKKKRESIVKDYSERMAKVSKGATGSFGVNIAGYGANWHE